MSAAYPWLLALHVVAWTAWMAGLLYLPRLYVYHAEAAPGSDTAKLFETMERRLLRYIMNPAMLLALALGVWLASSGGHWRAPWLHGKLALVAGLIAVHMILARRRREFAEGSNTRSPRYYRVLNEVPTVLFVGIVILAIVKPF